jgi:hypothetical protein
MASAHVKVPIEEAEEEEDEEEEEADRSDDESSAPAQSAADTAASANGTAVEEAVASTDKLPGKDASAVPVAASGAVIPCTNAFAVQLASGAAVPASLGKRPRNETSPERHIAVNKGVARKHYQIHFGQGIPNPIFDQVYYQLQRISIL